MTGRAKPSSAVLTLGEPSGRVITVRPLSAADSFTVPLRKVTCCMVVSRASPAVVNTSLSRVISVSSTAVSSVASWISARRMRPFSVSWLSTATARTVAAADRALVVINTEPISIRGCKNIKARLDEMKIDGQYIRVTFLRPELQSKLGYAGYDAGAKILTDFIKEQVQQFISDELDPVGRRIIDLCLNDAPLEEYLALTPMNLR